MPIKPKYAYFLYRMLTIAVFGRRRVRCEGWSAALERGVDVWADAQSRVQLGRRVYIKRGTAIEAHNGSTISIGAHTFINKNTSIIARGGIRLGENCLVAEGVSIYDHNYCTDDPDLPYRLQGFTSKPIHIGNNVWIGAKAFIGRGVTIGDNAIIGAHAIITRDVPANSVAYGRTELVIKERRQNQAPRPDTEKTIA